MTESKTTSTQQQTITLTIKDLVNQVQVDNPNLFQMLPEAKAIKIARLLTQQLVKNINEVEQGMVRIPSLGSFNVRQVLLRKEDDGKLTRRIIFRAAKS